MKKESFPAHHNVEGGGEGLQTPGNFPGEASVGVVSVKNRFFLSFFSYLHKYASYSFQQLFLNFFFFHSFFLFRFIAFTNAILRAHLHFVTQKYPTIVSALWLSCKSHLIPSSMIHLHFAPSYLHQSSEIERKEKKNLWRNRTRTV